MNNEAPFLSGASFRLMDFSAGRPISGSETEFATCLLSFIHKITCRLTLGSGAVPAVIISDTLPFS